MSLTPLVLMETLPGPGSKSTVPEKNPMTCGRPVASTAMPFPVAVDPGNQKAEVSLVLALTDQLGRGVTSVVAQIRQALAKIADPYDQAYYEGIFHEREARAFLGRGKASVFAYDGFRDAMDCYERAEKVRPVHNDDAVLRYNSCVRTIQRQRLKPRPPDGELQLE